MTKTATARKSSEGQVMPNRAMRDKISDDWSFAHLRRAETLWGPHGYHRYPAKFIPQLVRRIIDIYSTPDDIVADPFLGSATTGVEALRSGRRFWGTDISPIAILISRAKCTPINPAKLSQVWEKLNEGLSSIQVIGRRQLTKREKTLVSGIDLARASNEERLAYWFPLAHTRALDHILQEIIGLPGESTRMFFLCAFSNILKRCSIWLSGSTKSQKDLEKTLNEPVESFRQQSRDMLRRNKLYWEDLLQSRVSVGRWAEQRHLRREDARKLSWETNKVDLLVTSPPYATCYQYTEIHQLTQLWFEKYHIVPSDKWQGDCIGLKSISGRKAQKYQEEGLGICSSAANSALAELEKISQELDNNDIRRERQALGYYFQDMQATISEFARVVNKGKYLVIIIGDSRKRGVNIPTSAALCDMAVKAGFKLQERITRKIPARVLVSTRNEKTGRFSSVVNSDSQVYPEENILIFKKQE